MCSKMLAEILVPEGISVSVTNKTLNVSGPKGELTRLFNNPRASVTVVGDKIAVNTKASSRPDKRILGTYRSHVNNMLRGVSKGYRYELTVVQTHFPIRVKVEGDRVIIENFLGEKKPRIARIMPGAKVTVKGEIVTVEATDKEIAGQTAANIEIASKVQYKDRRVFGDGVFITKKAGAAT